MELSYWEYKTWLSNIDYTIVGSGIVGLTTALYLKERFPKAKIIILEKGSLPQGASTKNAGFACFGSASEVLADLKFHSQEEVVALVEQRFKGIQLLRKTLGDENIGFQKLGGHELFLNKDENLYHICRDEIPRLNQLLEPVFSKEVFKTTANNFAFKVVQEQYITHVEEGQIDTGKLMFSLLQLAAKKHIQILNSVQVTRYEQATDKVAVNTDKFDFTTKNLILTTNGFASQLIKENVKAVRAQVLITKPIENLKIKGTFHFDEGYFYFRNIDNRILFGGGRNLDFKAEETNEFGQTEIVQKALEDLLKNVILPNQSFNIEHRWSGIMGVGSKKKPIIKQLSNNVFCGVRLGGMGIAIGSLIGKELAELV